MIEQLCGLAYVALFVSRLVGLTVTRALLRGGADDAASRCEPNALGAPWTRQICCDTPSKGTKM